jgi:hypothetical protein
MKYAMTIQLKLLNARFYIERADDIKGGERFYLGIGAVITIYDNGTVMVQGTIKPRYKEWSARTLKRILPPATLWQDK